MKFALLVLLTTNILLQKQENAAPSIHLYCQFATPDAILKMHKVKIEKSANASYFEVNSFTKGYAGLQQTSDKSFGTSNILIASLWDPDTRQGVKSTVNYCDGSTSKKRFGGEGDGWKTINPFQWKINNWYNIVNRSWKSGGRLYIATFINDISSGKWLHTATFSIPDPGRYLTGINDAFMENWNGMNASEDGRFVRKAFFKDSWNLNLNGKWEKSTLIKFSANDGQADISRNGKYHYSFNAYYDSTEDAYCMQHGGDTKPSEAFQGKRTLILSKQARQGDEPHLTVCNLKSVNAGYKKHLLNINWIIDDHTSPQLTYKVEICKISGEKIKTIEDSLPDIRNLKVKCDLPQGQYIVKMVIRDIFDHLSNEITRELNVK